MGDTGPIQMNKIHLANECIHQHQILSKFVKWFWKPNTTLNSSMDTSSLNAFISCTLKQYIIKYAIQIILE